MQRCYGCGCGRGCGWDKLFSGDLLKRGVAEEAAIAFERQYWENDQFLVGPISSGAGTVVWVLQILQQRP